MATRWLLKNYAALGCGGGHDSSRRDVRGGSPGEAQGLTEITINAPKEYPTTLRSLADVGDKWSVVLAEPVAAVTVLTGFGTRMQTWYTFPIEEVLRKQAVVPDPVAAYRAPAGIEPPRAWQVLFGVSGGDLRIQGIMVHQLGMHLEAGKEYVLVVLLRGGDNVSWLTHPTAAALSVGADGSLTPLKESAFSHRLAEAGVNSADRLREALRNP